MPGTDTPRLFQGAFRQLNKFFVVISVNLYLTRGHYISAGREIHMRVTEKLVKSPEEEGVTLAYIRLTKDFEEIKEYVRHKGDTLTGYKKARERASVRIEDILYFETVDGLVFAYTVDSVYEIKGRLYQIEDKVKRRTICRASKTMLVNVEHITSVRTALNGRLYARMENGEEILITRRYAKEIEDCFMEDDDDERI